jgi:Sulfotransferase domain
MLPTTLMSDDGLTRVEIELPTPDAGPTILPIAYHKAGSVMLDGILKRLCKFSGRPYVNIEQILFNEGHIAWNFQQSIAACFSPTGIVNGVYRSYLEAFETAPMDSVQRIFLIRDPRDVIVSYYFSLKTSHFVPDQGETRTGILGARATYECTPLNDAVMNLQFQHVFDNMTKIARQIERCTGSFVVFRYEDIIFQKKPWIGELAKLLRIELREAQIDAVMREFDIVPKEENVTQHIRRVTPGDYRDKLSKEALDFIMSRQQELFRLLGYA